MPPDIPGPFTDEEVANWAQDNMSPTGELTRLISLNYVPNEDDIFFISTTLKIGHPSLSLSVVHVGGGIIRLEGTPRE